MATIPYYQAPEPVTPKPDYTVSGYVMEAGRQGMIAFQQAYQNRQRFELEQQKFVQEAALDQDRLQLAREKMAQDAVQEGQQLAMQRELNNAHAEYYRSGARAATAVSANGLMSRAQLNQEKAQTLLDFNTQVRKYKLDDPNPKNPVEYFANYQRLHDEFAFSNLSDIENGLKQIKLRTEQHKIPLKIGEKGTAREVPVGQIVQNLNDPDKKDEMLAVLEKNSLASTKVGKGDTIDKWTPNFIERWFRGELPKTTEISPKMQAYTALGKNVDFSRGKSRVPAAGVGDPNADAPLPERETTLGQNLFQPTETDKIVAAAKAAIPRKGRAAVEAMLRDQYNIDPSKLDE